MRYYKATDGTFTVFRATERQYLFGVIDAMNGSPGVIGFANGARPGGNCCQAIEITKSEYEALCAAKVERIKNNGRDPKYFTSPQDSWVLNRALPAEPSQGFRLTDRKFTTRAYPAAED